MSTFDAYAKDLDPSPRVRKMSGPFVKEESLRSVADAVAFCERIGVDQSRVRLAHNYVSWEAPETPEQVSSRIAHAQERQRRHLAWITETHAEYVRRGLIDPTPTQTPTATPAGDTTGAGA